MRLFGLIAISALSISAQVPAAPQAYVPDLTPIEVVNPIYSAEARAQRVRGEVQVLITIDGAGSVTKVEALLGPKLLQPAAIDAVKQERFRPVIRNGKPVVAYTDQSVIFFDGTTMLTAPGKLGDDWAAFERLDALKEKFPRSPQQILADFEQNLIAVKPRERSCTMPAIARAALDAGDLGRAASYAIELMEAKPGDYCSVKAIHEGNTVIGVVSLRRGDVAVAKDRLRESAQVEANHGELDYFGPNMRLAKELLEKGEREAVLQYFEACRKFWTMGAKQLDAWSAAVRAGRTPDFGGNLNY